MTPTFIFDLKQALEDFTAAGLALLTLQLMFFAFTKLRGILGR